MPEPLLEAFDLRCHYPAGRGPAVDGVHIRIDDGEVLGLVGESGCGKSTLARVLVGLQRPTAGEVRLAGRPIERLTPQQRAHLVQMVFQDSRAALDPLLTVGTSITLGLPLPRRERLGRAAELLAAVGLPPAYLTVRPGELSGGQRQRVCLARALSMRPRLLVADEPLSALDVSAQARVLQLLLGLRLDYGLAMLFIAHDLGAVRRIADRVAVMHLGRLVEVGPTAAVLERPRHPLTHALVTGAALREAPDIPPSPLSCPFAPRCPHVAQRCRTNAPLLIDDGQGRSVACHFPEEAGALAANR